MLLCRLVLLSCAAQANPQDADSFPFMVLGNKVDVDGGNARVVSAGPGGSAGACKGF